MMPKLVQYLTVIHLKWVVGMGEPIVDGLDS